MGNYLYLLLGLLLLTVGGEVLIRGALAAAVRAGVSPLLSGLVVVGFGTSAPELVVSINAVLNEQPDIATGNVVGSNIANILLILGLCALIFPLQVKSMVLRRDAVSVIAASLLFVLLASDHTLGHWDGVVFLICLALYLSWAYRSEKVHAPSAELYKAEAAELTALPVSIVWVTVTLIAGLLMLIAGSQVLITGAVGIAKEFGVSEAVIGLTLVAVGTSLPELTISVIAAFRRHADVAVGNILGSNLFNLLGIAGISALLQPLPVSTRILQIDQWVMTGAAVVLLLFLFTGRRLSRLEGALLLLAYLAYMGLGFKQPGI